MNTQVKFALIRYYDDESTNKKTYIVPISKIKNFVEKDNYNNYPFFVWKPNCQDDENDVLVAAQVLDVAESEQELTQRLYDKRPSFKKLRLSDAVQMILEREKVEYVKEEDESSEYEVEECAIKKQSQVSKKKKAVDNTNETAIMDEKLASMNMHNVIFEKIQSQRDEDMLEMEMTLKKEISVLKEENGSMKQLNELMKEELEKCKEENKTLLESINAAMNQNDFYCQELLTMKSEVAKLKLKRNLFPNENKSPTWENTTVPQKVVKSESNDNTVASDVSDKFNFSLDTNDYEKESIGDNFTNKISSANVFQKYPNSNLGINHSSEQNKKSANKRKKNIKISKSKKSKKDLKHKENKKGKKGKHVSNVDVKEFEALATHPNMTVWYDESKGEKIKMIHLYYGISITYAAWKEAKLTNTACRFLRNASRSIWTIHKLMNRALDVESCKKNRLPHQSPRKNCTPVKKACLKKIYDGYCDQKYSGKTKRKEKKSWTYYLGIYINYLITTKCNKIVPDKKTRKLLEESGEGSSDSSSSSDESSNNSCESPSSKD